ncbi:MAG TPA: hypothetical protein VII64_13740 [Thermodesulfobacteriota bacterium]
MKKRGLRFAYELLAAFVLISVLAGGVLSTGPWAGVAERIEVELSGGLKLYEAGKLEAAEEKVVDAYFVVFEGEKANMEIAVRQSLSLKRAVELEKGFSEIRKAMHGNAPVQEVRAKTSSLLDAIRRAAAELDAKGVGLSPN